jgi:putative transposase
LLSDYKKPENITGELETQRDRNGSFAPQIVAKGQTRLTGFDDKIISMYGHRWSM